MLVHALAPWSLSSGAINVMNALRGVVLRVYCADDERQIAAFAAEMGLSGDERQV